MLVAIVHIVAHVVFNVILWFFTEWVWIIAAGVVARVSHATETVVVARKGIVVIVIVH